MPANAADTFKAAMQKKRTQLDTAIFAAFKSTLQKALEDALSRHDAKHQQHIEIGDNYGWMVCKDGKVKETYIYSTQKNEGTAREQLRSLIPSMPQTGWSGVLMAGMKDRIHGTFYTISFEKKVLYGTIGFVKKEFVTEFKGQCRIALT